MSTVPVWFTAAGGPYAVVLTPQTNTAGVLADTTPVATLTGNLKSARPSGSKTTENIMAMDSSRRNMVPLDAGTDFTLVEILKKSGTNMLATAYYGSADYFKLAITRGAQVFTYFGIFASYEEDLEHGESLGTGVFQMVDPGAANPTYA